MPENPTEPTPPFDVRTIRHLVRLMQRYELTALDWAQGETRIRLRRQGSDLASSSASAAAAPVAAPTSASSTPADAATPAGPVIESPMVGTFYASRAPDEPPYVAPGSPVRPDTTVCVIEAMKVFTEIPAGLTGTVTEVLVQNGQPVEYGQPLFRVSPA